VSRAEVLDGPPGTRPHRFLVLDGLRGIAALVIVVFHTGSSRFIPGGYLAVDLFFCLSGFVLAHAYAAAPIGLGAFVKARLIRLYPLYLVGLIIGVMVEPVGLLNTLTGLLFLPAVSEVAQVYRPYPFNVPAWSLLFELVVNLMWFPLRRAGTRGLGAGLVVAAAVAVGAIVVSGKGDIGSTGPWFFVQGMCRVIFPFFLGVLLHRAWARGRLSFKSPWWLPAVVMCGMFMLPGPRVLVDTVCVVVLVPLIVALGAAARAGIARLPPSGGGVLSGLYPARRPAGRDRAARSRTAEPVLFRRGGDHSRGARRSVGRGQALRPARPPLAQRQISVALADGAGAGGSGSGSALPAARISFRVSTSQTRRALRNGSASWNSSWVKASRMLSIIGRRAATQAV
jgi:hypothetical protein